MRTQRFAQLRLWDWMFDGVLALRRCHDACWLRASFIAASGDLLSILDVAKILRAHFGNAAGKVPTRELPN